MAKRSSPRRYAALLRGVSPVNAKMPELARAFEAAGFTDVVTVLSSGNLVFTAPAAAEAALATRCEDAMRDALGKTFPTLIRSLDDLDALLASDPYAGTAAPAGAKRVVTFLRRAPTARLALPISLDGAHIVRATAGEVFSAYLPSPKGPVFMTLIEKTFGKDVTTRTWDTIVKIARKR